MRGVFLIKIYTWSVDELEGVGKYPEGNSLNCGL